MYINGRPISDFNANAFLEYSMSGMELENQMLKGKNRTTFALISQNLGYKALVISVVFHGRDKNETTKNKSAFDAELMGIVELQLPDGFLFTCVAGGLGEESWKGEVLCECEYSFTGIRHEALTTLTGNRIYCLSNVPKTDCALKVTTGKASSRYKLWNAYFSGVSAGDQIVFDGINKRILINGSPRAEQCEWIDFPYLKPGWNDITCTDPVTVEYYPTYM